MGYHENRGQFERAQWHLGILAPLWAAQIISLSSLIGIFAYHFAETLRAMPDSSDQDSTPTIDLVWEAVNIGLCLTSLGLTLTETVGLGRGTLTPSRLLWTHGIKLVFAIAVLAIDVVVYLNRNDIQYAVIGLAIDGGVIAFISMLGLYAILTYRRTQRYEEYRSPVNMRLYGYSASDMELEGGIADMSSPSSRGRSPSYGLQRDTRFEDYVSAQRASLVLKDQVDMAIGAEFGWDGSPGSSMLGAAGEPRGSIVSSGTVPSARAQRRDHARRMGSWTTERVLASLPEQDDEDDQESQRSRSSGGDTIRAAAPMPHSDAVDHQTPLASQGGSSQ